MEIMDWIFVIGVLLVINIGMTYIAMKDIKYLEKTVPHTQEIDDVLSAKIYYLERKLDDIDNAIGDVMMDVSSLKPLEDDDDLY